MIPVAVVAHRLAGAWVPVMPRVPPSRTLLVLAGLTAAAVALWQGVPRLVRYVGTARADAALAHRIVYPGDPDNSRPHAIATPRERNTGLPRALVRELRRYPKDRARKPHNPDNRGLLEALRLLGASRDPEATEEVLAWVHGDAAPDVRRAAVRAAAGKGNRDSVVVMATLLPEAERLFDPDPAVRYGTCRSLVDRMRGRTDRRLPPEFSGPRGCDVFATDEFATDPTEWRASAEALSLAADTPVAPDSDP